MDTGHQILVLTYLRGRWDAQPPAPLPTFAPRAELTDPLSSTSSSPSLTDRKWTHTPGDFSRLCRIWLLLITTCGACRAAGFVGGKLPPVHVSSTHTLALP